MRAPLSWLRELVDIPADQTGRDVAERVTRAGLEVESVESIGEGLAGPLVVGRVLEIEELTEFKKPIRFCQVEVGPANGAGADPRGVRGVICGARNFIAGDLVAVALPGTTLPGGFVIGSRETYGRLSDGMICSEREMGLGDGHDGILVLPAGAAAPGDDAAALLGIGDEILDVAVTPDRGYALSMRGLAREVAMAYGVPFVDPALREVSLPAPSADRMPAECASDDLDACPLFTLRTIVGFDPAAASPGWMQRRLTACGMRPVSLAVDVTNYVMLELGQPLHAFDLDKLHGPVRAAHVAAGTPFETLDHVQRTLAADDLCIMDDTGPIGLAGVMGGLTSEIDDDTTNIALEAAFFDAGVIARASRRHRLSSEASRRFERGIDRMLAPYASARAAALLLEHGGGHYVGMTAVEAPIQSDVIDIDVDLPERVAGMDIDAETVVANLRAIGCEVEESRTGTLRVSAPSWRPDLTDRADLVEEVVRLVGYEQLPSTLPVAPAGHGLTKAQRLRRRIGMALAARGNVEVLTFPFVGPAELDALRVPADDRRRSTIRLANPLSDEQPNLRGTLLPGLLAAAARNVGRGAADVRLFELGQVFLGEVGKPVERPSVQARPDAAHWQALNDLLPHQPMHLAVIVGGDRVPTGWWGKATSTDWSDAVAVARMVGEVAGVDIVVEQGDDPVLHPGRAARLVVASGERVVVGIAGELHPRTVEALGLPVRSSVVEIDLTALTALAPDVRQAPTVSGHPVAKFDLAFVVGDTPNAGVLQASLVEAGGPLLESVRMFDAYAGAPLEPGERSLAFAVRLRAADRTLANEEIEAVRAAMIAAGTALRARIRG